MWPIIYRLPPLPPTPYLFVVLWICRFIVMCYAILRIVLDVLVFVLDVLVFAACRLLFLSFFVVGFLSCVSFPSFLPLFLFFLCFFLPFILSFLLSLFVVLVCLVGFVCLFGLYFSFVCFVCLFVRLFASYCFENIGSWKFQEILKLLYFQKSWDSNISRKSGSLIISIIPRFQYC